MILQIDCVFILSLLFDTILEEVDDESDDDDLCVSVETSDPILLMTFWCWFFELHLYSFFSFETSTAVTVPATAQAQLFQLIPIFSTRETDRGKP